MSDSPIKPAVKLAKDQDWNESPIMQEGLKGTELITALVKHLPNQPGVYRMMNGKGDVLYVGKARNLKKRVTSYAQGRAHSNRIHKMVALTEKMEFISTRTETESLLLEANLIKRLRPKYNVLLRDDKSFPYIMMTGDHEAAGIFKHRGARARKGHYFGPFASAGAVTRTLNSLHRAFMLRNCTDSYYEGRTRPCLQYQIKRCAGPCTGEISLDDYAKLADEAKLFLSGKSAKIKRDLSEAMQQASDEMDFERAALYRDRLAALSHVQSHQGINPQTVEEADVFAIYFDGGMACIQVFFFRTGQNWGNRAYFPKADVSLTASEILNAFIGQFYDGKPLPKMVLLSEDIEDRELLEEAFSIKAQRKVSVSKPKRGEKKELVEQVLTNAKEAHGRNLAETSSQIKLLKGLAEAFDLPHPPRRVEVYDNSHIQGTAAVGGMIVSGGEGFAKGQYRKFNIKDDSITPGDDFGMMKEVMTRRFSRLVKEHGLPDMTIAQKHEAAKSDEYEAPDLNEMPAWPDLLLIDGGQGQMTAVRQILKDLEIEDYIAAIGVAKGVDREAGREQFFVQGKKPFKLPPRDPVLYFIQRMRDEAHRFAIGTHRAKRSKEFVKNPLDEISGIGAKRKKALLHHFGTAKQVAQAGVDDLVMVDGISEAVAELIYNHFHEAG
ncbi:excinuclease ABC subunit UvrC [Lentilitoribacter sp. Alg239-R112]|uniref:excinuclease ABC subunit UvrC n=1 Tax=Lentilitoribacter sp. Alg239-R112 TaxID=2305987 RepID=UPI0013A6A255|nr:excinuclease ABC subunit UvrC [Lentilitoribacter sp. Alg239-R112]